MKKLFLMLLAVAGIVYWSFSYFFSDIQINKYEDIETAKEQAAIENGWIPAVLPESSFDIVETHDLDTKSLFGRFKYKEEDESRFINKLQSMDDNMTFSWEGYLFKVDREKNSVKYRNRTNNGL